MRRTTGRWSWQCFLLGAGFMLLETKAITQFALLWGSTWVVSSLAIASVLAMALAANLVLLRSTVGAHPWRIGGLARAARGQRAAADRRADVRAASPSPCSTPCCSSARFSAPASCSGSAIKRSTSVARDYGVNLLGAMTGGVAEYASLVTGYRWLAVIIAVCYVGALVARQVDARR
jgi:hypothetical protein